MSTFHHASMRFWGPQPTWTRRTPPGSFGPSRSGLAVAAGCQPIARRRADRTGRGTTRRSPRIAGFWGAVGMARSIAAARASPPYHGAMRLTAWEEERLLIFRAAHLSRRHRAAGLALNAPEAV